MKNKKLLLSEDAQSTVIGFVLIMGILIVASTSYFAYHIPDWTKAYESLHAADVTDDFSELKSLIDGIVLKQGESELAGGAAPVKMVPDKVPILGMSPPGSNLDFLPGNEIFKITPAVTGGATSPTIANFSWVESTTDDFSNMTAKRVKVDVTLDRIKLSRVTMQGDLILNTSTTLSGEYHYDKVEITNGCTVYLVPGYYLKLYANTITLDSSCEIIADDRGYLGGDGGKMGAGMGYGKPGYSGSGGGGAGYGDDGGDGGKGGNASDGDAGTGGISYGDNTSSSFDFGSGGGGGGYGEAHHANPFEGAAGGDGGDGGGAVLLDAAQITIAGDISADGSNGMPGAEASIAGGGGGGGSGGAIVIRGHDVSISGTLSAKGGDGGVGGGGAPSEKCGGGGGGGGAGGRIKIFYENASYTPPSSSVVAGGAGGTGGGGTHLGNSGDDGNGSFIYENETSYISSVPHYSSGYYVSRVHDTGNTTTCYGNMTWDADTDEYTPIVMKVRTSVSPDMEGNATLWENCPAVANGQVISDLSSAFDWHRYIQYRAELSTYEATMTPELYSVRINYSSADPAGGSPTVAESSGIIRFNSNYFYYPNQEIAYEHGALIKWQPEGGFMLHPPPINITSESGVSTIEISMVDLTGAECSYSGATTISVENIYKDYDSFSNKFDNLTLNLTTAYPPIWDKWFNNELEESGLDAPDYNVSVNATAKTVSVEFYGHGDGVELHLEKTVIEVKI